MSWKVGSLVIPLNDRAIYNTKDSIVGLAAAVAIFTTKFFTWSKSLIIEGACCRVRIDLFLWCDRCSSLLALLRLLSTKWITANSTGILASPTHNATFNIDKNNFSSLNNSLSNYFKKCTAAERDWELNHDKIRATCH